VTQHDSETFADGNMTPVVRIGREVRRALPLAWKASHAVLRHLETKGFPYSPRLLRHDDEFEWLCFMPGKSLESDLAGHRDLNLLVMVGQMIRQYHEAMRDFVPPPGVIWSPGIRDTDPVETICHNDIAPWNTIVNGEGVVTGLIDWDLVRPGPVSWDLAYAAWRFGLLEPRDEFGSVRDRGVRIVTLLDAYGFPLASRRGFIDLIRERAQHGFDIVEILGKQGAPGFATLYEKGAHHWGRPSMDWIDAHRSELIAVVEP
jgi:Ser/Thr protein kinase RdoA (MazF antagonist)